MHQSASSCLFPSSFDSPLFPVLPFIYGHSALILQNRFAFTTFFRNFAICKTKTIINYAKKERRNALEIHPSPMKGKDGKNLLYVRPRSGQKVTMRQLDDYCAQHYALRPGELTRSFNAFIQATGYYLAEGYRLETLIGSFAPKIGLRREITDAKDVKNYDVRFEGIEYKSVKSFEESVRNWLRGFRRANNPDTQELLADTKFIDRALSSGASKVSATPPSAVSPYSPTSPNTPPANSWKHGARATLPVS